MKIEISDDEIIDQIFEHIKKSLENKTFEIGDYVRNFLKSESELTPSNYIGKTIVSKILEIIEKEIVNISCF